MPHTELWYQIMPVLLRSAASQPGRLFDAKIG